MSITWNPSFALSSSKVTLLPNGTQQHIHFIALYIALDLLNIRIFAMALWLRHNAFELPRESTMDSSFYISKQVNIVSCRLPSIKVASSSMSPVLVVSCSYRLQNPTSLLVGWSLKAVNWSQIPHSARNSSCFQHNLPSWLFCEFECVVFAQQLIVRHGLQQFRLSVLRLNGVSSSLVKSRCESGHSPTSQQPTLGEENIRKKLQLKFPKATFIQVNDISGNGII